MEIGELICTYTGTLFNVTITNSTLNQPAVEFNKTSNYVRLESSQWDFDISYDYKLTACFSTYKGSTKFRVYNSSLSLDLVL